MDLTYRPAPTRRAGKSLHRAHSMRVFTKRTLLTVPNSCCLVVQYVGKEPDSAAIPGGGQDWERSRVQTTVQRRASVQLHTRGAFLEHLRGVLRQPASWVTQPVVGSGRARAVSWNAGETAEYGRHHRSTSNPSWPRAWSLR
jgi:hypothetical protein